jgi:hypothetical protein
MSKEAGMDKATATAPARRARVFVDARLEERCQATITLRDKSTAQCGRRAKTTDGFCTQHARMFGVED